MRSEEKRARLLEATAALLAATPNHGLKITVLNKALFYFDLFSLLERGRTVTGNAYIALKEGPVIADYPKRLVEAGEAIGMLKQETGDDNAKPVRLVKQQDRYSHLDAEDLKLAGEMAQFVHNKSAAGMSALSHENPGWCLAWRTGGGAATKAPMKSINMHIALQQLADADDWLQEPLSSDEASNIAKQHLKDDVDW